MKNTKIMAALAIFLVAALFIGAASAAATPVANGKVAVVGDTISLDNTGTAITTGYLYPLNAAGNQLVAGKNLTVSANIDLTGVAEGKYGYSASIITTDISFTASASTPGIQIVSIKSLTADKSLIQNNTPTSVSFEIETSDGTLASAVEGLQILVTDGASATAVSTAATSGKITQTVSITPTKAGTITASLVTKGSEKTLKTITVKSVDTVTITPAAIGSAPNAYVYQRIYVSSSNTLTLYKETAGSSQVLNVITGKDNIFDLLDSVVNGQYGAYYDGTNYVNIWYPELTLKAELVTGDNGATSGDSIDGKTINKATNVAFIVEAPKVAAGYKAGTFEPVAKIVFTTPVGGKTTDFGEKSFASKAIDASQVTVGYAEPGNDAATGTWTAQAEFSLE